MLKFRKIKKAHGWGWVNGTCDKCSDDTLPLNTHPQTKRRLCYQCYNEESRIKPGMEQQRVEEKELDTWNHMVSLSVKGNHD